MNEPEEQQVSVPCGAGLIHATTQVVTYPSSVLGPDGAPVQLTGIVHLPLTAAPADGWPVVTYAHMTTGAGDRAAPSLGAPGHPEWHRMSRGDALCDRLCARGVAVLRPDYPGIGSPGVHPYLIGDPLARSVVDMMAARHSFDTRIGDRWAAAGHSEGATATLFATVRNDWPVPLRAAAAFAPVTRMDLTIGAASRVPVVLPRAGVVSALIGLMLLGASTASSEVADRISSGGLSARATELWPHLTTRSLEELAASDSWGSIAPSRIADRGLYRALFASMRSNELARLVPQVPVRVDSASRDEVAPAPLTSAMVRRWRRAGVDVTHRSWPSDHPSVMDDRFAPSEAADWLLSHLQRH